VLKRGLRGKGGSRHRRRRGRWGKPISVFSKRQRTNVVATFCRKLKFCQRTFVSGRTIPFYGMGASQLTIGAPRARSGTKPRPETDFSAF